MGREEQVEEREVLDSIFPEEITDISETEYRISMALDVPTLGDEDEEQPVIQLSVRYGEAYPDEAPTLDITAPPNAARHDLLERHQHRQRNHPQQVHHTADKQQGHQQPAAADAISAMQDPQP